MLLYITINNISFFFFLNNFDLSGILNFFFVNIVVLCRQTYGQCSYEFLEKSIKLYDKNFP